MAVNENTTTALNQWNFDTKHVQKNLASGDFVGSHSCIICATVPRLEMLSNNDEKIVTSTDGSDSTADQANIAIPIGIVSDFSAQQQAQLQELYEIGSKRKYTVVSGRTSNAMSIARAQYDGPSLLRMLYAFYPKDAGLIANGFGQITSGSGTKNEIEVSGDAKSLFKLIPKDSAPGYENFWLNMMSSIFTYPFGIMLVQKNSANNKDISATLFENCYVAMHQIAVSAGQVIVAESAQLTFDRVVPIKCHDIGQGPAF